MPAAASVRQPAAQPVAVGGAPAAAPAPVAGIRLPGTVIPGAGIPAGAVVGVGLPAGRGFAAGSGAGRGGGQQAWVGHQPVEWKQHAVRRLSREVVGVQEDQLEEDEDEYEDDGFY